MFATRSCSPFDDLSRPPAETYRYRERLIAVSPRERPISRSPKIPPSHTASQISSLKGFWIHRCQLLLAVPSSESLTLTGYQISLKPEGHKSLRQHPEE